MRLTDMSKKKSTARNGDSKRRARAVAPRGEPGPADLERAARALYRSLKGMVERFEKAEAEGKAVGETWPTIRLWQRRSTRQGASLLSGLELAIRAYAERTILEDRRRMLGIALGRIALQVARGETDARAAVQEAGEWRGDDHLGEWEDRGGKALEFVAGEGAIGGLRSVVGAARGEASKWRAAYNTLAWEADVWPSPDTARGKRGPLGTMYKSMTQNRD